MNVRGRHPGKTSLFLNKTPDLVGPSFEVVSVTVRDEETAFSTFPAAAGPVSPHASKMLEKRKMRNECYCLLYAREKNVHFFFALIYAS